MSDKPESTANTEAPKQDTPQAAPPVSPDTSQGQPDGNTQGQEDVIQFTPAQLKARLERDWDAEKKRLLEDLGLDSFDTVKKDLEAKRKADEAAMSELEKAQAEIEKERQKAQKALDDLQALQKQMVANSRKTAFMQAVQDNGGKKADKLFVLVESLYADDFAAVFGTDTSANEAQMKRFIQKLQNEEPEYFGSAGAGNPSSANGFSPNAKDNQTELHQQMRNNARKTF